jgi:hypothetical protein
MPTGSIKNTEGINDLPELSNLASDGFKPTLKEYAFHPEPCKAIHQY